MTAHYIGSGGGSYAVTSLGLWHQRKVLSKVLGGKIALWPLCNPGRIAAFVGWGGRPSGNRADMLARRFNSRVVRLEDGFLRSVSTKSYEPSHSYVIDAKGMHFDRTGESDLLDLITNNAFFDDELQRASDCMAKIRELRLTKYNDGGELPSQFIEALSDEPFVLVVDQVAADASIPADINLADACAQMLTAAARDHPRSKIVVRPHPANKGDSPMRNAAAQLGAIESPNCNPWFLLERARAVYTISSHLGFEALMAGKPVVTYGAPFYAGWGLTTDRYAGIDPGPQRSVPELFAAAYLRYSVYYDPQADRVCQLEDAIELLRVLRDEHNRALAG